MTIETVESILRDEYPDLLIEKETIEHVKESQLSLGGSKEETTEEIVLRVKPNNTLYIYKEIAKIASEHKSKVVTPWQKKHIRIRGLRS